MKHASIDMGAGDDILSPNERVYNSGIIDVGAGNDKLIAGGLLSEFWGLVKLCLCLTCLDLTQSQ